MNQNPNNNNGGAFTNPAVGHRVSFDIQKMAEHPEGVEIVDPANLDPSLLSAPDANGVLTYRDPNESFGSASPHLAQQVNHAPPTSGSSSGGPVNYRAEPTSADALYPNPTSNPHFQNEVSSPAYRNEVSNPNFRNDVSSHPFLAGSMEGPPGQPDIYPTPASHDGRQVSRRPTLDNTVAPSVQPVVVTPQPRVQAPPPRNTSPNSRTPEGYSFNPDSRYTEVTCLLPSYARIYDPDKHITEHVTLRNITTADERRIFGSSPKPNFLSTLIYDCITSEKFNPDDLITGDFNYLLYMLRIHTYGPQYSVTDTCDFCGAVNQQEINLNDVTLFYLVDDYEEPYRITLPSSKDVVGIRMLSIREYRAVEGATKHLAKRLHQEAGELSFIHTRAKMLVEINDKPVPNEAYAQQYISNMHGMDSAYFEDTLTDFKLGFNNTIDITCEKCGHDTEAAVSMSREFFRPRFRKSRSITTAFNPQD